MSENLGFFYVYGKIIVSLITKYGQIQSYENSLLNNSFEPFNIEQKYARLICMS